MHSKSDSYSFIVDKAMQDERAMGYKKDPVQKEVTSTQPKSMINRISSHPYFEFLLSIALLTIGIYIFLAGIKHYLHNDNYVFGVNFHFSGTSASVEPDSHFCDGVSDSNGCFEIHKGINLTLVALVLNLGAIYLLIWFGIVNRYLRHEIAELEGRSRKYEGRLNDVVVSKVQRKNHAEESQFDNFMMFQKRCFSEKATQSDITDILQEKNYCEKGTQFDNMDMGQKDYLENNT